MKYVLPAILLFAICWLQVRLWVGEGSYAHVAGLAEEVSLEQAENERKRALFERIAAMPSTPSNWRELASSLPSGPTIDLVLRKDRLEYRFFTTVTTFGTPQDVTLQELRIESYFPSDDATRGLCDSWQGDLG